MHILSKIIITLIALEHLYILWIEMFAWTSVGKKVFRGAMPPQYVRSNPRIGSQPRFIQWLFSSRAYLVAVDTKPNMEPKCCHFFLGMCSHSRYLRLHYGSQIYIFCTSTTRYHRLDNCTNEQ